MNRRVLVIALLVVCTGCGTIPGRMYTQREVRDYRARPVSELNVRGSWVTAETGAQAFDQAIQDLKDSIDGRNPGGDLRFGVVTPPLFAGGTIVLIPIPYWYRPGKGGYVQAFPVANYADHYMLAGAGMFEMYLARVVEEHGQLIGINEYKGWLFGGVGNTSMDYRYVGQQGGVEGILKTWTYRLGPIPFYWKAEYLALGEVVPGDYPPEQPGWEEEGPYSQQPEQAQPPMRRVPRPNQPARPSEQPAETTENSQQGATRMCRYCNSEIPAQLRICPICGSQK